jgi:hypothetical protein
MTTRTRYFVIASLLVLAVGLGAGLVAYSLGFPTSAFSSQGGPDELQYVPSDATLLAFANVHEVMTSDVRQRLRAVLPGSPDGQREFQTHTGINIETDIDHVVACVAPVAQGQGVGGSGGAGMVLARGRFDTVRIEGVMREHGAEVETYNGVRLITVQRGREASNVDTPEPASGQASSMAVAFIEHGLAAVGSPVLVRRAIDLREGGANVTGNDEMMTLVRSLEHGNAWAVGRFDALSAHARLPEGLHGQLPPITWFSASGRVNGGVRGFVQAQTRDEESASNLRDVVRGFIALAKMHAGQHPEIQTLVQSLQLGGSANTVALSFDLPLELFEALASGRLSSAH